MTLERYNVSLSGERMCWLSACRLQGIVLAHLQMRSHLDVTEVRDKTEWGVKDSSTLSPRLTDIAFDTL